MNKLLKLLPMFALLAAQFTACNSNPDDPEPFSVRFSLAEVPTGLTLDSLEIEISIGDTGKPQKLSVDLETGTSQAQVLAFPGQKYKLTYALFASGFDIGKGGEEGTLSADMKIELEPTWNNAKIASARAAREQGKLLPPYLESSFGQTLAGKPLIIAIDSAKDRQYTWYVRLGDSTIANGAGAKVSYTPADNLGGQTLNIKVIVKKGNTVVEERDWDVRVLGSLPTDRLVGIITKADTGAREGTYIHFRYNAEGKPDSLLFFDTTAFVSGRPATGTLAITYTQAHRPSGDPSKVVRTSRGDSDIDSAFSYDAQGRLVAVTVTIASGTTADSISYVSDKVTETRSYAQGKLMRRIRHVALNAITEVDSVYSRADTGLVLSGLVTYDLQDGKVINRRVYVMTVGMQALRSEWTYWNALGSIAFRNRYEEGAGAPTLQESETYAYKADGNLDRILVRDEVTQEILRVRSYVYQAAPKGAKAAAKLTAPQRANLFRMSRLADLNVHFPLSTRFR